METILHTVLKLGLKTDDIKRQTIYIAASQNSSNDTRHNQSSFAFRVYAPCFMFFTNHGLKQEFFQYI